MDRDVRITTCEAAWTRRKHTVNARSEIGTTVTVTVDRVDVDIDRVAKPPYCHFACRIVCHCNLFLYKVAINV